MEGLINWDTLSKLRFSPDNGDKPYDPAVQWGKVAHMYDGMAKLEKEFTKNQIAQMILTSEDRVVDIGCGPGRLSVPIAKKVKALTAVDVADEMLDKCLENAKDADVDNITAMKINWNDADAVKRIGQHDIAIASRSVGLSDLLKLNAIAKKYVFIVCWANGPSLKDIHSDFVRGVTEADEIRPVNPYDRLLGYNVLFNQVYDLGANPSVVVVDDGFERHYETREEAYKDLLFMADVPAEKMERFKENIDANLTEKKEGGFHLLRKTKSYVMWWKPEDIKQP